jgi:RNA polymerase sigma-70 factor (ECF subfamily)
MLRMADRGSHAAFYTTQWSVVLAAGQASSPQSAEALEALCTAYWYPLYAYVRRRVDDVHRAQDLLTLARASSSSV